MMRRQQPLVPWAPSRRFNLLKLHQMIICMVSTLLSLLHLICHIRSPLSLLAIPALSTLYWPHSSLPVARLVIV